MDPDLDLKRRQSIDKIVANPINTEKPNHKNLINPKELLEVDTNFFISGRMHRINPLSLHGLGLFSMDGIKVGYGTVTELMEYVGPLYKYTH
jgi:hypothetical protein